MNWDTAPQELDALRAQVAALTKERDRWQEAYERCNTVCGATEECWNADLAAAQAQITQLREALETISDGENWGEDGCWESSSYPDEIAMEALATPTDTAALDARLAQERERCAVVAEKSEWIAAQIRSMK
jgi:hypothetical protein